MQKCLKATDAPFIDLNPNEGIFAHPQALALATVCAQRLQNKLNGTSPIIVSLDRINVIPKETTFQERALAAYWKDTILSDHLPTPQHGHVPYYRGNERRCTFDIRQRAKQIMTVTIPVPTQEIKRNDDIAKKKRHPAALSNDKKFLAIAKLAYASHISFYRLHMPKDSNQPVEGELMIISAAAPTGNQFSVEFSENNEYLRVINREKNETFYYPLPQSSIQERNDLLMELVLMELSRQRKDQNYQSAWVKDHAIWTYAILSNAHLQENSAQTHYVNHAISPMKEAARRCRQKLFARKIDTENPLKEDDPLLDLLLATYEQEPQRFKQDILRAVEEEKSKDDAINEKFFSTLYTYLIPLAVQIEKIQYSSRIEEIDSKHCKEILIKLIDHLFSIKEKIPHAVFARSVLNAVLKSRNDIAAQLLS